jgi:micrococcal nuclease
VSSARKGPRRFPLPRRKIIGRSAAALLLAILVGWQWMGDRAAPPVPHQSGASAFVVRIIDGDTVDLADGTRVRLLGVDTPETKKPHTPVQPWGPEASEFTRRHVEGRMVRLEFDKERRDKYDRVLAYVYLDNWFLNEELIRAGMGHAITNHPYSEAMKRRFRAAEQEAKEHRRGIWSAGVPAPVRRGAKVGATN